MLRWQREILYHQKLEVTSPTSGDRSIGSIVGFLDRSRYFFFEVAP
jgi:hypothetical protein